MNQGFSRCLFVQSCLSPCKLALWEKKGLESVKSPTPTHPFFSLRCKRRGSCIKNPCWFLGLQGLEDMLRAPIQFLGLQADELGSPSQPLGLQGWGGARRALFRHQGLHGLEDAFRACLQFLGLKGELRAPCQFPGFARLRRFIESPL